MPVNDTRILGWPVLSLRREAQDGNLGSLQGSATPRLAAQCAVQYGAELREMRVVLASLHAKLNTWRFANSGAELLRFAHAGGLLKVSMSWHLFATMHSACLMMRSSR